MREALADWANQPLFPLSRDKKKKGKDFDAEFTARAAALPEEQRLYVGPDFLDPDARRIANQLIRELKEQEDQAHGAGSADAVTWPAAADLPHAEWFNLFRSFGAPDKIPIADVRKQSSWPTLATANSDLYKPLLAELELARDRRDREYAAFRAKYRLLAREFELANAQREYLGREWFKAIVAAGSGPTKERFEEFLKKLRAALSNSEDEPFDAVVPARLSGPSRIAFRVDCDDYEPDRPAGRIPFTLEGLTNWGGMDMAVVRRAERPMEPLQGTRLPPRWERRALNDPGAILRFQGFTSSERWGRSRQTRPRAPAPLR